jgi:hypothetical protein
MGTMHENLQLLLALRACFGPGKNPFPGGSGNGGKQICHCGAWIFCAEKVLGGR